MAIIRGTTPTIEFIFTDVAVSDITTAILSLKQLGKTVIEHDISSATVDESLSWKLTQEETLSLNNRYDVEIVCDWKLTDGTRGRSHKLCTPVGNPGKDNVI